MKGFLPGSGDHIVSRQPTYTWAKKIAVGRRTPREMGYLRSLVNPYCAARECGRIKYTSIGRALRSEIAHFVGGGHLGRWRRAERVAGFGVYTMLVELELVSMLGYSLLY